MTHFVMVKRTRHTAEQFVRQHYKARVTGEEISDIGPGATKKGKASRRMCRVHIHDYNQIIVL